MTAIEIVRHTTDAILMAIAIATLYRCNSNDDSNSNVVTTCHDDSKKQRYIYQHKAATIYSIGQAKCSDGCENKNKQTPSPWKKKTKTGENIHEQHDYK